MMDPLLLGPVVLGIAGLSLTLSAFRDIWFGHASTRWPTTRARVLAKQYDAGTLRSSTDTSPVIRYEYLVGGQRFDSNRYAYSGKATGTAEHAAKIGSKFEEGGLITIHYDPFWVEQERDRFATEASAAEKRHVFRLNVIVGVILAVVLSIAWLTVWFLA